MGEVDITLDMSQEENAVRRFTMPVSSNPEKARRRVRGALTFEYHWTPTPDKASCDALLSGQLEILVLSGEDLISIDWKGSCSSDPYVVVVAYPESPHGDSRVLPVWHRTETVWDTSNPRWNQKVSFDIHWTQEGTEKCMQADMKQLGHAEGKKAPVQTRNSLISATAKADLVTTAEPTDQEKRDLVYQMVPQLEVELKDLHDTVVPCMRSDLLDLKQDLDLIVSTLRKRGVPSANRPADSRLPPAPSSNSMSMNSGNSKLTADTSTARTADVTPWAAPCTELELESP